MDPYIELAQKAIEHCLNSNLELGMPKNLPPEMLNTKAGVFVSLHRKSDRALRGCIGTFLPAKDSIAREIISNAISAAFKDPRFLPITKNELNDLEINVDILSEPSAVDDISELDPNKYGLIVKGQNNRSGLLLPNIGVNSVAEQISICCQKAGLDPKNGQLEFYKFTVTRHK